MMPWLGRTYRTLNTLRIDGDALRHNLNLYRARLPGKAICPVLKANAYGHGLVLVAKALMKERPEFWIVDSLYEAYELTKAGLDLPILILGYTFSENLTHKRLPFHFAVSDLETVHVLAKQKATIHLKIDTGMNRMGFSVKELPAVLKKIQNLPLKVEGIFTHFADADNPIDTTTHKQFTSFREAIGLVRRAGFKPPWIHAGGASAIAVTPVDADITMVRLGLALYGVSPYKEKDPRAASLLNLRPAMEILSTLVGLRSLKRGDRVSYNGTFVAHRPMTVGIVPFGYYEGLPRHLSNKGCLQVQGRKCPIVGRVCMNYTIIDVTGLKVAVGDKVQVVSLDPKAPNSFAQLAKEAGTIPYELMVRLAASIRREAI